LSVLSSPAQVAGRLADEEPERAGWDKYNRRRRTLPRPGEGPKSLTRDDLLSVSEASALLGVNTRTLYRLIDRRQVPGARRLGRTVVVVRPILEHWLLTGDDGGGS
jgi:excisionase family DNA binding protein